MTAHNILKNIGFSVNEQGAIRWLMMHGVELNGKKFDIHKLYELMHTRISSMPVYKPQSAYEYDVLYASLEEKKVDAEQGIKLLKSDGDSLYYVDSHSTYENELPEHMGTEVFLEIESYDFLMTLEELQEKVNKLEE